MAMRSVWMVWMMAMWSVWMVRMVPVRTMAVGTVMVGNVPMRAMWVVRMVTMGSVRMVGVVMMGDVPVWLVVVWAVVMGDVDVAGFYGTAMAAGTTISWGRIVAGTGYDTQNACPEGAPSAIPRRWTAKANVTIA